jgi:hypothetical protein
MAKTEIFKVTLSPIKRQIDADAVALVAQFFGVDAPCFADAITIRDTSTIAQAKHFKYSLT